MKQEKNARKLKRRDFLVVGAAGIAGAALATNLSSAEAAEAPHTGRMAPSQRSRRPAEQRRREVG